VISGSFTALQKVVVVVRARRGRRLSRMSVGLTLNGGTLVAQNRDERRDIQPESPCVASRLHSPVVPGDKRKTSKIQMVDPSVEILLVGHLRNGLDERPGLTNGV
jgi:hypothetical protein